MKTKSLFLFTCIIILTSFKSIQAINEDPIYKVTIFRWSKSIKGVEQKRFATINQDGSIVIDEQIFKKKLTIKSLNVAIDNFIKTEKIVKVGANNDPPRVAIVPKNGELTISIAIIKLKDFNNEKEFENKSQYIYNKIEKSSDQDIYIYKYLDLDDLKVLKEAIE